MTVPELGGVAFARAVAKSRKVGLIPEHRNIGEILMFGNLEDTAKTGHSAPPPPPFHMQEQRILTKLAKFGCFSFRWLRDLLETAKPANRDQNRQKHIQSRIWKGFCSANFAGFCIDAEIWIKLGRLDTSDVESMSARPARLSRRPPPPRLAQFTVRVLVGRSHRGRF